jgi:hypothetical protein
MVGFAQLQEFTMVLFKEFESVVARLRHAFTELPTGIGLLSPCNAIIRK